MFVTMCLLGLRQGEAGSPWKKIDILDLLGEKEEVYLISLGKKMIYFTSLEKNMIYWTSSEKEEALDLLWEKDDILDLLGKKMIC